MGRMPRSVAVSLVLESAIFVLLDDLGDFVGGEVEPLAVSADAHDPAMGQAQVDLLFQQFGKFGVYMANVFELGGIADL